MTETGLLVLAFYVLLALAIGGAFVVLPRFFAPRAGRRGKRDPYECGVPLLGPARQPVNTKFYLYALLFVLFDVETALLVLWALVYREPGGGAWLLATGGLFLGVLGFALAYLWRRGALDWESGAAEVAEAPREGEAG